MQGTSIIAQVFYFVIYLVLQVVLMQNVVLFDVAFCFLYIGFLLLLPFESGPVRLMFMGLAIGLCVDIFYNSFGIHAAASVFIMYLRPHIVSVLAPRGGYETGMTPKLKVMGLEWFSVYALILIFLHHLVLFFVEAGGFEMFGFTLLKVAASTVFTFVVILIIQYLFYSSKRSL
ncbi:hypothetical protein [Nafulsella turpanensis]|uniref:hypothetical protein n=1 Tax=Nafulsella turpanensis TaxID=1265690 RepID=UPI0003476C54|nr:hypothetical protein [Nafulsella turpanensis]